MTTLIEAEKWEDGIYQLEKTDPVVAGLDGIANRQAQQLANRTQYLKTEQDKLKTATAAATTAKSGTTQLSSSVTDVGETKAATTKAVKIAMDRANEAHTLADGKADAVNPNFVLSKYTDLNTQLGKDTRFFSFNGSSTIGVPSSYNGADGIGWQVGDAGQRTQFSIAANNNLYIRTDDSNYSTNETAWNSWSKFILDSDNASTTTAGIVQLSSSLTDAAETKAATTKAVRDLDLKKANLNSPVLTGEPTAPTAAQTVNSTQIATTAFVKSAIAALVGGAPAQLDTLEEIATALGNNANLNSTLLAEISKKANATDVATKDHLIGIPLPYPKAQVPSGFLAMNGQAISQTTYPKLFALYGARLPDLRGEFIRGWDNARNVDRGRGILSAQGDAIRNITGSVRTDNGWMFRELSGAFFDHSGGENTQPLRNQVLASDSNSAPTVGWFDFDASKSGVPTAAENRPRNIAMQYICLAG